MNMTRLDAVIKDIEEVNKMGYAWIYDADGNIKDDVICGNVLPLLYELKDYEVEATEEFIDWIIEHADRHWNTYNWNANIDHDIDVAEMYLNGYTYMAIMVHRYGDIRANYTDRFLVRFDNKYDWFEFNSRVQGDYLEWTPERIKRAFNFGNGTEKDLERYIRLNKQFALFKEV